MHAISKDLIYMTEEKMKNNCYKIKLQETINLKELFSSLYKSLSEHLK